MRILVILPFTLLALGCGSSSDNATNTQSSPPAQEATSEANEAPAAADVTLVLNAGDELKFDKEEFRVPEGQEVTLTLNHTGQMAKEGMGHNFVLLKQGTDVADFATRAVDARENDYIPEGSDDVIVHTELLGGGESDTITFPAPPPGTYDFICSFPGHYALMQGKFIVE